MRIQLRVADAKDSYLDLDDVYEIQATGEEIDKLRLRRGDILLTEGGDRDKLGRGTFWQEEIPLCIHQNHIFRVRLDPARGHPQFVSAEIGSSYGKAYFLSHAKQTTGIATINQTVLRAFPMRLPDLETTGGQSAMSQSLVKNLVHLVYSTKHRQLWLPEEVRDRLFACQAGIFRKWQSPALIIGGAEDTRTPAELLDIVERKGQEVAEALAVLRALG